MQSIHSIAPDDVVRTLEESRGNERVPLLVLDPLERFLDEHGLGAGETEVLPIGEGHSNVTYLLRRGGTEMVIRRPPRPPLPPSAHDVLREVRVLEALEGRVPVPRVLAACEDPEVIGAPFYVMNEVDGFVLGEEIPAGFDGAGQRRAFGEEIVDALVLLHSVDWKAAGLEGFGRTEGYLERQLRRFGSLWEQNRTRDLPAFDRLTDWLAKNLPQRDETTIVHGDYRLGNVMFAPQAPPRLLAVFDWEMSTLGDPLADLGYFSVCWIDREDPAGPSFNQGITRQQGFSRRRELMQRYSERSGRDVSELRWYETLALWKATIFMEGNYKRASLGATDDPFLRESEHIVTQLAARAEKIAFGTPG